MVWWAVATALLVAKPWGEFGWEEWVVLAAPLLLMHNAVRLLDSMICGFVASALAWYFLSHQSGGWLELVCLWLTLGFGNMISFAALRNSRDVRELSGGTALLTNEDLFFESMNREMCRARREKESFAVLSLDRKSEGLEPSLAGLCEFLDFELRSYADIAKIGDRVLALVPDVHDDQCQPLVRRLLAKSEEAFGEDIRIGLARFPEDAICADDLIDLADRKRLVRGVTKKTDAQEVEIPSQATV
jgi:hypothetical protein